MDEQTTTDVPVDTGAVTAQPEVTDQTPAAEATENKEQQTEAHSEPSEDEQLASWAKNKGLELDSDNATKAAKMAWNAERAMHQKAQKASELEKSLSTQSDEIAQDVAISTGQDPELLKRLQRVEVRDSVRDFYDTHPDAREIEADMIAELQERPHLAGDLEALYAVVKSRNLDAVKSQAKRETLESLAHKQTAAVPRGNAVNSGNTGERITRENVDRMVAGMSVEEYKRRLPEINTALRS